MTRFLSALQFLTIVPLKIKQLSEKDIAGAMIYFPFVGLLLGLALSGINMLLVIFNFSPLAASIILVVALIGITGGMHLDGLSDSSDAFLSGKTKDQMLIVMRDPHIGVMGVVSIASVMLLKIALLSAVAIALKPVSLVLACVLSRWSSVLAIYLFPYSRPSGKVKVFKDGMNLRIFILSSILALVFVFGTWRLKGVFTLLIAGGFTYLAGKYACRKIGGITGDTLGAIIELTEIIVLFTACIG